MIIGAGLAGLITAHLFPGRPIIEAAGEPTESHRALLRFRSDVVSRVTGSPFRPVTVRKGIWHEGGFHEPSIQLANLYSRKCLGKLLDRSIWDLAPVTRWIAPDDFYWRLMEPLLPRIEWASPVNFGDLNEPVISTAPLPVVLGQLGIDHGQAFNREQIAVKRYYIPGTDVHQTVYFPSQDHALYRASITDDTLICEFVERQPGNWRREVANAFGIPIEWLSGGESVNRQKYGKIAPIDDAARKALVHTLTTKHDIFSVGRFATWRNILLDDVVQDAEVVKRLLEATSYERRLAAL